MPAIQNCERFFIALGGALEQLFVLIVLSNFHRV
jgi:hypothetical protein